MDIWAYMTGGDGSTLIRHNNPHASIFQKRRMNPILGYLLSNSIVTSFPDEPAGIAVEYSSVQLAYFIVLLQIDM